VISFLRTKRVSVLKLAEYFFAQIMGYAIRDFILIWVQEVSFGLLVRIVIPVIPKLSLTPIIFCLNISI
jgi:hypothetical protein